MQTSTCSSQWFIPDFSWVDVKSCGGKSTCGNTGSWDLGFNAWLFCLWIFYLWVFWRNHLLRMLWSRRLCSTSLLKSLHPLLTPGICLQNSHLVSSPHSEGLTSLGLGLSLVKVLGSFLRVFANLRVFLGWGTGLSLWGVAGGTLTGVHHQTPACGSFRVTKAPPWWCVTLPRWEEEQEVLCPFTVSARGEIFHSELIFTPQKPPKSPGATWGGKKHSQRFSSGVGASLLSRKMLDKVIFCSF